MQTDDLLNEIADSLEGADRAIYLLNKWTVEEEKLKVEIDRLQELNERCYASSWLYRPFLKWRLFKQLDALLTSIDAKKDIDAHRILKEEEKEEKRKSNRFLPWHLLKPSFKKMTLSFLVLPDRVLITYRGWFRFGIRIIHMTRLKIRLEVQKWHRMMKHLKEIRDIHDDDEPDRDISTTNIIELENKAKETAEEIAKQLQIPGILKKLPEGSSLKIIPDDVLHGFPFAAIYYDGKYLVERYSLSIDFEQETGKNKTRGNKKSKALLVGVSAPVMGNPPLGGVSKELEMIEDWYKKSCREKPLTLSNHEANKKTVLQRLTQCKYFHIACHGTFKPDKPDQSGLLLVPAPNEMEMLSIRELSNLNLAGLEHSTLSSCWSADNFIAPGRIIISLPETLRRAGAKSILGSLWPLHDSFAIAFMKRFYDYLEKYPRDKALQKTQLDCINKKLSVNGKIKPEKPSHWAAFNLYGSAKRLPIGK
jgi:CHAT domain-containing protein